MTPRGRRVAIALAGLTGLLFAGRWTAEFLSERWWIDAVSPAGAVFGTRWALLRLGLELGAILVAAAWFSGNLLLAVQLRARLTDDQPSPASSSGSPPGSAAIRWWALGAALLLAVLCGAGTGAWTPQVLLALEQPRWGLAGAAGMRDAGFYLATLPVLLRLEGLGLALAGLGFVATTMLYAIAGTLRVAARRFVLDPRIRLHLGILGSILGLVLAAGYLLEPWELAAGLRPSLGEAHRLLLASLARVLAGLALAAAVLTLVWGVRGRMMVPVGAWASLALFALAIRLLAPAAGSPTDLGRSDRESREREQEAFGIPTPADGAAGPGQFGPALEAHPALWSERTLVPDSGRWLAADRLTTPPGSAEQPILLLIAPARGHAGLVGYAVPDREVTAAGGPLTLSALGAEPAPGLVPFQRWPEARVFPGNLGVDVSEHPDGVLATGFLRRLALSWALQVNVFGAGDEDRVAWRTDPEERLAEVAPFAQWGSARPRIVDGRLVWISDGYFHAISFPGVAPTPWRGRPVSYLRAGLVGVVDAERGGTRVFQRGDADPLGTAWAAIAGGLIEPWEALPPGVAGQLHYPTELLAVQGRVLQRSHWALGALAAPIADSLTGGGGRLAFGPPDGGPVGVLAEAHFLDGLDRLRLVRFDSMATLDEPRLLGQRWERLPFVTQMGDSVRSAGARMILGRIQIEPTAEGLVGFQAGHAVDSLGRAMLVLVNVAQGGRLGTGSRVDAAWRNLRGEEAALPRSLGPAGQLREARLWLLRADSAFRRGDLAGFGRAFEALRAILDFPPGSPK
jgi:hypothetical protein